MPEDVSVSDTMKISLMLFVPIHHLFGALQAHHAASEVEVEDVGMLFLTVSGFVPLLNRVARQVYSASSYSKSMTTSRTVSRIDGPPFADFVGASLSADL
jgi:hypothetical protein